MTGICIFTLIKSTATSSLYLLTPTLCRIPRLNNLEILALQNQLPQALCKMAQESPDIDMEGKSNKRSRATCRASNICVDGNASGTGLTMLQAITVTIRLTIKRPSTRVNTNNPKLGLSAYSFAEYKTWKKNSPFLYDMILR